MCDLLTGELHAESSDLVEVVAIKVLKETASREAEEDFLREVDIMSTFRHSNILSLLGVVLRGKENQFFLCMSVYMSCNEMWS